MKVVTLWGLCGAAVVAISCAALLAWPVGGAHAQSGSRLCGYIKKTDDGGYVGYLFEGRQADVMYTSDCAAQAGDMYAKYIDSGFNEMVQKTIMHNSPDCHLLPSEHDGWHRHCDSTCEDVGVLFQSSNSPKDMCDKMEAHQKYKVVFDKASNTTSYKKL